MPVRGVRRRYLSFEVHDSHHISGTLLLDAFEQQLSLLFGVKGLSKADLRLIEYKPENMNGILRCSHNQLTQVRAALAHLTEIGGAPATIRVNRVSGTIKALRRKECGQ